MMAASRFEVAMQEALARVTAEGTARRARGEPEEGAALVAAYTKPAEPPEPEPVRVNAEDFVAFIEAYYGRYRPLVRKVVLAWCADVEPMIGRIRDEVIRTYSTRWKEPPDVAVLEETAARWDERDTLTGQRRSWRRLLPARATRDVRPPTTEIGR